MGEQDVGGFDVAVQQIALVRVVQRVGDRGDDVGDLVWRQAAGVALGISRAASVPST